MNCAIQELVHKLGSMPSQSLTLVDGNLCPTDAYIPVTELVKSMQSYYWLRNFGAQERFNRNDNWADDMLAAIEQESESIQALIEQAKSKGQKIRIAAKIELSLDQEYQQ